MEKRIDEKKRAPFGGAAPAPHEEKWHMKPLTEKETWKVVKNQQAMEKEEGLEKSPRCY